MDKRDAHRIICDIGVLACTTLDVRDARVVNLSPHGAKLCLDEPYPVGAAMHLDVDGDFYWGTVVWAEHGGMGIRFRSPLAGGALHAQAKPFRTPTKPSVWPFGGFGRRQPGARISVRP